MAYNYSADPFVRELSTLLSGQSQADVRARDEGIRRAVVNFGMIPDFGSISGMPQIDATTRALAQQATQQGVSQVARLRKQLDDAQLMIPKQLAARGMLFSGETGYALGEAQKAFNTAQYDATRELIDYISGAMAAVAQREQERQTQLLQAGQESRLRQEATAREDAYRQQQLALQQAANAASYGGGGGGGDFGGGGGDMGGGTPSDPGLTYTGRTTAEGLGIYTDAYGAMYVDTGQGFAPYSGAPAGGGAGTLPSRTGQPSPYQLQRAQNIAKKAARNRTEEEKQWLASFQATYGPVSNYV